MYNRPRKADSSFVTPFSRPKKSFPSSGSGKVKVNTTQLGGQSTPRASVTPLRLHNIQTVTPNTRRKIKQTVALCVQASDKQNSCASPGFEVPFDLSQSQTSVYDTNETEDVLDIVVSSTDDKIELASGPKEDYNISNKIDEGKDNEVEIYEKLRKSKASKEVIQVKQKTKKTKYEVKPATASKGEAEGNRNDDGIAGKDKKNHERNDVQVCVVDDKGGQNDIECVRSDGYDLLESDSDEYINDKTDNNGNKSDEFTGTNGTTKITTGSIGGKLMNTKDDRSQSESQNTEINNNDIYNFEEPQDITLQVERYTSAIQTTSTLCKENSGDPVAQSMISKEVNSQLEQSVGKVHGKVLGKAATSTKATGGKAKTEKTRKPSKSTKKKRKLDKVRQSVLKSLLKMHLEIQQFQTRRKKLMSAAGAAKEE